MLRKLDQAVTIKDHDIQTFASGLRAESNNIEDPEQATEVRKAFYANMIDISNNAAAQSERARRKARQREIRERMEREERDRALQESLDLLEQQRRQGQHRNVARVEQHRQFLGH